MPRADSARIRLYGPRLLVEDFGRSWNFYRDVIGLRPVRGHGTPPYGEFEFGKGAVLGLFDRGLMAEATGQLAVKHSSREVGPSMIVFEVGDVDQFAVRLRRKRVKWVRGPTDRPEWALRTLHLRDPDGNLVEIESRLDR
ncbi:MAG TPA: VOC family protein [Thermoplasmata archaeon]|nr:VOC family protein [Thermoplasmata archaeon]